MMQLSFADLLEPCAPTWDDVQKKRARTVVHGAYTRPCREACLWHDDILDGLCYLFRKPVVDGMCPSTVSLEPVWAL